MIIALYVDDLILLTDLITMMNALKCELSDKFEMKDCSELHHCLGLNITCDRNKRSLLLDQSHFAKQILTCFGMTGCNPVLTPLDPSIQLSANKGETSNEMLLLNKTQSPTLLVDSTLCFL